MYTFAAKHGCLLASSPFDSIISAVFFLLFFLLAAPTHCELLRKLQVSSQSVPRPCLPVVWREVVGKEEREEVWQWWGGGAWCFFFSFFSSSAGCCVVCGVSFSFVCLAITYSARRPFIQGLSTGVRQDGK